MVAESGGSTSRFTLFGFYLVLDKIVPFPLSSFPLLIEPVESPSSSGHSLDSPIDTRAWNDKPPALMGSLGCWGPCSEKHLSSGLKPGPTQSHLLKGFAELKPEHGRIKKSGSTFFCCCCKERQCKSYRNRTGRRTGSGGHWTLPGARPCSGGTFSSRLLGKNSHPLHQLLQKSWQKSGRRAEMSGRSRMPGGRKWCA